MRYSKWFLLLALLTLAALLAACKPVTREGAAAQAANLAPAAEPTVLRFDTEPFSTYLEGAVVRGERARYSIDLQEDEYMQVYVGSSAGSTEFGNVAMQIWGPDGQTLPGAGEGDDSTGWQGVVPAAGEYRIEVGSIRGNAGYGLSVRVSPVGYAPLPAEECQAIQAQLEAALGLALTLSQAPFYEGRSDLGGEGCHFEFVGAGLPFADSQAVFNIIVGALPGWQEDPSYQAGGSTGVASGLTQDGKLMLVSVLWDVAEGVDCPLDQPITMCDLTPEQKRYVIYIDAAEKK